MARAGSEPDNEGLAPSQNVTKPAGRTDFGLMAGYFATATAAAALLCCVVLMVTGYVKCPYWDEWWALGQIADGKSPLSLSWLLSQQNEHRVLIPRLLIYLDLYMFGGRNILLFLATFAIQSAHWCLWLIAIRRWLPDSRALQLTIGGLFGYCIFCPNQIENFVWAFQFAFVFPLLSGTLAFVCVLAINDVKRPGFLLGTAIAAPVLAMFNLAGGLVIWPFALVLSAWRKVQGRFLVTFSGSAATAIGLYYAGYHTPSYLSDPLRSLRSPYLLFRYLLTYFGTSWWFLVPHLARTIAFFAIAIFLYLAFVVAREGKRASKFEMLLLIEGLFVLATAGVTALGRLGLGIGQASSSRYQSVAMLFWASLASLLLLRFTKQSRPGWVLAVQSIIVGVMIASIFGLPPIYSANRHRAQSLGEACAVVASGGNRPDLTKRLSDRPELITKGGALLRSVWNGN